MIEFPPDLRVDAKEIEETFIRGSGPGGQNVNKVATAVQLRFDVRRTAALTEAGKRRLAHLAGRRLGQDGFLTILARNHRTQEQNRREAMIRLIDLLRLAAIAPRHRVPTKPTLGSKIRRLDAKTHQSRLKQLRRNHDE